MKTDVRKALRDGKSLSFVYNSKPCGVAVEHGEFAPLYHAWYGKMKKDYGEVEETVRDTFFGGVSLEELAKSIVIHVS